MIAEEDKDLAAVVLVEGCVLLECHAEILCPNLKKTRKGKYVQGFPSWYQIHFGIFLAPCYFDFPAFFLQ